ncbi:hypothetical protein DC347_10255 [Pseudarthrobacter sp. AG30]|uniref:hypothetical protein n=1 Tax=Pseudarthrobacter sp. AG30 TaxID=2249742 RepID=UPI000D6546FA|nr:hypothetical protein [Pseudarthrobacter sp. AG30]RAX16992.1 hypothetical protein DC347_10255 [Pseudarthrobacter sp. AG30]
MVLLLGWVMLEHFVCADVAIRTTLSAGMPPVTALLLVALVVALTVLMACASHALLRTLLAGRGHAAAQGLDVRRGSVQVSLACSVPVGGAGPRAPGARRRRPGSLPAAL